MGERWPYKPLQKMQTLGKYMTYRAFFICLVGWRGVILGQLQAFAGTVLGTVFSRITIGQ